jgi:hypothetical protein
MWRGEREVERGVEAGYSWLMVREIEYRQAPRSEQLQEWIEMSFDSYFCQREWGREASGGPEATACAFLTPCHSQQYQWGVRALQYLRKMGCEVLSHRERQCPSLRGERPSSLEWTTRRPVGTPKVGKLLPPR